MAEEEEEEEVVVVVRVAAAEVMLPGERDVLWAIAIEGERWIILGQRMQMQNSRRNSGASVAEAVGAAGEAV